MTRNTFEHGVFIWDWNNERSYLVLETDDVLMSSVTNGPFHFLQHELKKLLDFTCHEGNVRKFLNLCLIQSPSGISIDQMQHITSIVLSKYFYGVPPSSIPFCPHPFPIEPAFQRELFEAIPLVGPSLQAKKGLWVCLLPHYNVLLVPSQTTSNYVSKESVQERW
jgi:hypothetical protein